LSHRVWIERRVSIGYFIIAKGYMLNTSNALLINFKLLVL